MRDIARDSDAAPGQIRPALRSCPGCPLASVASLAGATSPCRAPRLPSGLPGAITVNQNGGNRSKALDRRQHFRRRRRTFRADFGAGAGHFGLVDLLPVGMVSDPPGALGNQYIQPGAAQDHCPLPARLRRSARPLKNHRGGWCQWCRMVRARANRRNRAQQDPPFIVGKAPGAFVERNVGERRGLIADAGHHQPALDDRFRRWRWRGLLRRGSAQVRSLNSSVSIRRFRCGEEIELDLDRHVGAVAFGNGGESRRVELPIF